MFTFLPSSSNLEQTYRPRNPLAPVTKIIGNNLRGEGHRHAGNGVFAWILPRHRNVALNDSHYQENVFAFDQSVVGPFFELLLNNTPKGNLNSAEEAVRGVEGLERCLYVRYGYRLGG